MRSFVYAGAATLIAFVIGFPLAYAIAFRGGKWKNALLLLVIVPFFITYLIRTLSWQTILADSGLVVNVLQFVGLLGDDGRLLATTAAVIAGITYNFLPFMILPLYASLERIDPRMLEAGYDLYGTRRAVFTRVTLPLAAPGVVAGSLLTFIPAVGDFINAELLGTPRQSMIGNVIQSRFLELTDYPTAAALSFILMALVLVVVLIWATPGRHRVADGRGGALMEAATATARVRRCATGACWRSGAALLDQSLNLYAALALIYLLAPIAIIVLFSFNDPVGRFNFTWQGFTLEHWKDPFGVPGLQEALVNSIQIAALSTVIATVLGTMMALALVRYQFRGRARHELLHLPAAGDPGDRARRLAAVAVHRDRLLDRLHDDPDRARDVQHQLRGRHGAVAADRVRPQPRGGGAGPGRERVPDVHAHHPAPDRARSAGRGAARLCAVGGRFRDHELQLRLDRHVPAVRVGRGARRDPAPDQHHRDDDLLRDAGADAADGAAADGARRACRAVRPEPASSA